MSDSKMRLDEWHKTNFVASAPDRSALFAQVSLSTSLYTPHPHSQTVLVGWGAYIIFMLSVCVSVRLSTTFSFLLFILLNNVRNLFIFCINVDIDEMLLLQESKGLGVDSFKIISLFFYS